jgi:hypothetical protein
LAQNAHLSENLTRYSPRHGVCQHPSAITTLGFFGLIVKIIGCPETLHSSVFAGDSTNPLKNNPFHALAFCAIHESVSKTGHPLKRVTGEARPRVFTRGLA